mgnify:CR=1 FL=1
MTVAVTRKELKRTQILNAATKLFVEQGYANISMDFIAKSAEVSKQTVYSHFGSKEELFAASIKQKCDSYQMLDLSIENIDDPFEFLLELARRFVSMVTSDAAVAVHKICAYESTTYPQLSELFYQAAPERICNDIAQLMERLTREGHLDITDFHFAALQFLNIVKGEICLQVEFNVKQRATQEEIENYLVSSVKLFMKGYAK